MPLGISPSGCFEGAEGCGTFKTYVIFMGERNIMPFALMWRGVFVVIVFMFLFSCIRDGSTSVRYEALLWTNAWLEIRKRELALPLEIRYVTLQWKFPVTLFAWRKTIEDRLITELLNFHRVVGGSQTDAMISIELLPIRFQVVGNDRLFYEIRGWFDVWVGTNLFRSNVVIFERVFALTNYPEEKVYYHLITQWTYYLAENIHYGWSVSQNFSTIQLLGGTHETTLSSPWSQ